MPTRRALLVCFLFSLFLSSCEKVDPYVEKMKRVLGREDAPKQVVGLPDEEKLSNVPPPPEPVKMEPVINKQAKVSVLGYHDFTESRRPTQMIINIHEFRAQMKAIKDAEIPVISLQQFLDWKNEKKDIPPESIMITIDDGWKDTHTLAMPVLAEFGFPFTAFLYQKYVGVGGRSMTHTEIRELIENGGTICSHSVSHKNMAKPVGRSEEEKLAWLRTELEDSHNFLADTFTNGVIKAFAYPYGIYNDQVVEMAGELGYQACFTVSPGKTSWDGDNLRINRYIIHGNSSSNFNKAISFGSGKAASSAGRALLTEQRDTKTGEIKGPLIEVYPPSGSKVRNRLPRIEVNLSNLERVQTDSLAMRISGFGKVPHSYDKDRKVLYYQIPQRLRMDKCSVQVSFRHSKSDKEVIAWNFGIDQRSEYLSASATYLRPVSEPVDPEQELVIASKEKEEKAPLAAKNGESGKESSPAGLIDPGNTIN